MIIAIASQKGGTAKTSTAITLAAGLARQDKKILLIDLDSQANCSKVLIKDYPAIRKDKTIYRTILERLPLPVHKTKLKNLDIVPSHILLSNTDIELTSARDHREARLKIQLDKIKENYNHVFIDCPPALSWLTINGFTASDKVLAVVSPGYFELDSTIQLLKVLKETKELFNPDLDLLGFLFVMSEPTVNSRESLKLLRQTYPEFVLKTVIPRNVAMKNASFNKTDVFTYEPTAKSALAYQKLIKEIFK